MKATGIIIASIFLAFVGILLYLLFRDDSREEDGISRENLGKPRRKKKFQQDFGGDLPGAVHEEKSAGIPGDHADKEFLRAREIMEQSGRGEF